MKRSFRLPGWNYSDAGWYFITICAIDREPLFGDVDGDAVRLTDIGRIVERCWREIPDHFPRMRLDEWIVMPNHLHGIIRLINGPDHRVTHRQETVRAYKRVGRGTLSAAIGGFKAAVTKRVWATIPDGEGDSFWQPNFHDRVIRSAEALNRARQYIRDNPRKWATDPYHPDS